MPGSLTGQAEQLTIELLNNILVGFHHADRCVREESTSGVEQIELEERP